MQTIASTNQTALSRLPYENSFCILQSSWKIWSTTTTNWIMFTTRNQNSMRQTFRILFCWSISHEMFKGRSSESTMPFTKPKYSGMISSELSMIKTRRTYSLILFYFLRPSNISKGALLGTNMADLNSNCKSNSKPVRPQELCTSKIAHNYWIASSSEGSWHIPHLQAWQGNASNYLYISILLQAS